MSEKAASGGLGNHYSYYGCLFCRSGSEERIISDLNSNHPNMELISPKRIRIRRQGEREIVPLFPGYVFFHLSSPVYIRTLLQKNDVYRLLHYPNGNWELHGSDLSFVMLMFKMRGIIELSKARFTEDGLLIISGFLKDYEDQITKIDKRSKTAQVTINFHGRIFIIWAGFEIV